MTPEECLELDARLAYLQGWRWYRNKKSRKCAIYPPLGSRYERVMWSEETHELINNYVPMNDERYHDFWKGGERPDGYARCKNMPRPTTDHEDAMDLLLYIETKPWFISLHTTIISGTPMSTINTLRNQETHLTPSRGALRGTSFEAKGETRLLANAFVFELALSYYKKREDEDERREL